MNLHVITEIIRFWRTREGVRIPIKELSDDHILNIVRMFGHTPRISRFIGVEREQMLSAVRAEGEKRGILSHMGPSG